MEAEEREPGKVLGQVLSKLQEGTKVRMQNPHTKKWNQFGTILHSRDSGRSYTIGIVASQLHQFSASCLGDHPLKHHIKETLITESSPVRAHWTYLSLLFS